jgi:hypothetical protein
MTGSSLRSTLARPAPPENPPKMEREIDLNLETEMSIESTIRCTEKWSHRTPLPGEHLRGISSKRYACSILPLPKGQGFPAFLEEAPSKRGSVAS